MRNSGRICLALAMVIYVAAGCVRESDESPAAEAVAQAERYVPPLSGGTLLITSDGEHAVVSDPDRDRIVIVDLVGQRVRGVAALEDGSEPGRAVETADGKVFVLLRRAGAVVTVDVDRAKEVDRSRLCAAPRGITYDQSRETLEVVCAGGEWISLSSTDIHTVRAERRLPSDLRDVAVVGGELWATRFRSAEMLIVDDAELDSGQPWLVTKPPAFVSHGGQRFESNVAWRTVPIKTASANASVSPNSASSARNVAAFSGVAMIHQRSFAGRLVRAPEYYLGVGCDNSVVHATVSIFRASERASGAAPAPPIAIQLPRAVLPVDLAVYTRPSQTQPPSVQMAALAAGTGRIYRFDANALESAYGERAECDLGVVEAVPEIVGGPVALAFDSGGHLYVQTRQPAQLRRVDDGSVIALGGTDVQDAGYNLFHEVAAEQSPIACASCHPEAGDDGRIWDVSSVGPRRTQSLRAGIMETAPFHWDGDLRHAEDLMREVLETRMGGDEVGDRTVRAFEAWIDRVPRVPTADFSGDDAVERGRLLFEDDTVGCVECHGGRMRTNNRSFDVGTGGVFQTPALVNLMLRAPYMHNGCAATLADRFGSCGGGDEHGKVSHLSSSEVADLVRFLETL